MRRSGIGAHPIHFAVGALGILAAVAVWLCSTGTNDIRSWEKFAAAIDRSGLIALYESDRLFNHPPLMGWLAWLSQALAGLTGTSFAIVFKAFGLAGHVAAAFVVAAVWRRRGQPRQAAWAFALSSWGLASLLVASYHGNTDCLCAFFCLLSVYFLERQRAFAGGLALAAAINVKIIPVLLVLPALAGFRSLRGARSFALGTSCGAAPFLIAVVFGGSALIRNVFAYGSFPEPWGVQLLLLPVSGISPQGHEQLASAFFAYGKYALLAAIALLSIYGYRRRLDHARLMAAGFAVFLLLAPGFGVQYVAYLPPLMFAVSLRHAVTFSTWGGLLLVVIYADWSIGVWPWESVYRPMRVEHVLYGFAAWLTLPAFIAFCLRSRSEEPSSGPVQE